MESLSKQSVEMLCWNNALCGQSYKASTSVNYVSRVVNSSESVFSAECSYAILKIVYDIDSCSNRAARRLSSHFHDQRSPIRDPFKVPSFFNFIYTNIIEVVTTGATSGLFNLNYCVSLKYPWRVSLKYTWCVSLKVHFLHWFSNLWL